MIKSGARRGFTLLLGFLVLLLLIFASSFSQMRHIAQLFALQKKSFEKSRIVVSVKKPVVKPAKIPAER
ncbi:MAG: hypothetical protein ACOYXC_21740 [Candidatus Rifleibacteriota bacterium]